MVEARHTPFRSGAQECCLEDDVHFDFARRASAARRHYQHAFGLGRLPRRRHD